MNTRILFLVAGLLFCGQACAQDLAIRAEKLHTMHGAAIDDGVVLIQAGKITAVGSAQQVRIPQGVEVLQAKVATPGLVDARSVVGLAGYMNQPHDQDQLETSSPLQPQLRAMDAYNPRETLVQWLRELGVTTLHTGHGPGSLLSGQTMVVKTRGNTVEAALIKPQAMLAAELGPGALAERGKSPGTRAKQMAMLRSLLLKARAQDDAGKGNKEKDPADASELDMQAMRAVLARQMPLMVTAWKAQDIMSALRLKQEFNIDLILDGAAESYLLLEAIKQADVPVILHPPMARQHGELENASFTTAAQLHQAGIRFALQSGYEAYVPKTRVVLWEAAIAAAHGLPQEAALASITIDAARIIGLEQRVGSLEVGKDGDVVLFDGDPLEYTSHVTGVVIDGVVVSRERR